MFLVVHASGGALLGEVSAWPWLAALLGLTSHYVLDVVPHGDEVIGRTFARTKRFRLLAALFIIDFTAAFCLLFWLWLSGVIHNPETAFVGAIAALLPDILSGLHTISSKKILPGLSKFHNLNHQLLGLEIPVWDGAIVQLIFLFGIWMLFLQRLFI